ncbi:hypothetical protein ACM26F_25425, partial [Kluyvera sichuanensis]|uniref:hypothetical protein n=1 Tax=Kluyvera sichuanensis TaxID=2725494 RepID=UPI0039F6E146
SSSVKYGLWGNLSLKSLSATLLNVPSAYGGLLCCTSHVLISFLGFYLRPDFMLFRQVDT